MNSDGERDPLRELRQKEAEAQAALEAIRALIQRDEQQLHRHRRRTTALARMRRLGWKGIVPGIAAVIGGGLDYLRHHVLVGAAAVAATTALATSMIITPIVVPIVEDDGHDDTAPGPRPSLPARPGPAAQPVNGSRRPSASPATRPAPTSPVPTATPEPPPQPRRTGTPPQAPPPPGSPPTQTPPAQTPAPQTPPPGAEPSATPTGGSPSPSPTGRPEPAPPEPAACILGIELPPIVRLRLRLLCD